VAPLATAGLPFRPGEGFDVAPAIGALLALLHGRWIGIAWSRRTVALLLTLGTALGYAAGSWGVVRAAALGYAFIAGAAIAGALRDR
jgi:hypothetical protein